jgi:streptomycin 6-kinase
VLQLPTSLVRATQNRQGSEGHAWLTGLPELVSRIVSTYGLTIDGAPYESTTNFALPVLARDGRKCVLKVSCSQRQYELETAALQHWHTCPAVVDLQAWDAPARALLLLRADPGTTYDLLPDTHETLQRLAASMKSLWAVKTPAVSPFSPLAEHLKQRMIIARARIRSGITQGVVDESDWQQAINGAQALFKRTGYPSVVLHADWSARNIVDDGRWLKAIDPKPCIGDPAYDAALWAVRHENGQFLKRNIGNIATLCQLHPLHVLAWARVIALDEVVCWLNDGTASKEACQALVPFIGGGQTPDA